MEQALFFELKRNKPTGFFRANVISGSKIWKFLTKSGEINYEFIGLNKELMPMFRKIKSDIDIMMEGLDIIRDELSNY